MELHPNIIEFPPKQLVGISLSTSLANDQTVALWQAFMPTYAAFNSSKKKMRYSLQEYPPGYFDAFNPHTPYTKWALCEWDPNWDIPLGWGHYTLAGGQYALFKHRGADASIFQRIFMEWLPSSEFRVANRPHFEMFEPNYQQGDAMAEEVIALPVESNLLIK